MVACVRCPRNDRARCRRGVIAIARGGNCRSRCRTSRRRRRRRRRRAGREVGRQLLTGADGRELPTCSIAPVLREGCVIQLHPHHQRAIVESRFGVDGVVDVAEGRRTVLIQGDLEIDCLPHRKSKVGGPELDVEDAVGRRAGCGGEHTAIRRVSNQVAPIRRHYVSALGARPAGDVKHGIGSAKLQ